MKISAKLFCLLLTISLAGCWGSSSVSKFNDDTYLRATSVEPLEVPEHLEDSTSIESYYPAPPGEYPKRGSEPMSLVPPGLGDLIEDKQGTEETE